MTPRISAMLCEMKYNLTMSLEDHQQKDILNVSSQLFDVENPLSIQSPELTGGFTFDVISSLNDPEQLHELLLAIDSPRNDTGDTLALIAAENPRNPSFKYLMQIKKHPPKDGHGAYATISIYSVKPNNDAMGGLQVSRLDKKVGQELSNLRIDSSAMGLNVTGESLHIPVDRAKLSDLIPHPEFGHNIPFLEFDSALINVPRTALKAGAIPN
jgi:hypothetical protein